MVRADTILESLVIACKVSDLIPSDVTYSTVELDAEGEHSDVSLPIIEFQIERLERNRSRNTEKVGKEYNTNGTEIGYVYSTWFDLEITASVITAPQTSINQRDLHDVLETTLYKYDVHGPSRMLPDPDAPVESLSGISWFVLDDTAPKHDFTSNPTIRGRQLKLDVAFTDTRTSSELGIEYETVDDVEVNVDGDSTDSINEDVLD